MANYVPNSYNYRQRELCRSWLKAALVTQRLWFLCGKPLLLIYLVYGIGLGGWPVIIWIVIIITGHSKGNHLDTSASKRLRHQRSSCLLSRTVADIAKVKVSLPPTVETVMSPPYRPNMSPCFFDDLNWTVNSALWPGGTTDGGPF